MSRPEWVSLAEQLQDADPKVRRQACKRLTATSDPAVIPFLRRAYLQEEDERVRDAAYEGLATFKAMQMGESTRRMPLSDEMLTRIVGGLAVVLVILLLANVAIRFKGESAPPEPTQAPNVLIPWEELTAQLEQKLTEAQEDSANLRAEIVQQNNTGQVVCQATYHRTQPVMLSEINKQTYRDLGVIADNLDLVLLQLQHPQLIWDRICQTRQASMTDGLDALKRLDVIDTQLAEVDDLLQKAIASPAPTIGPTLTPTPTLTETPAPTETPLPGTPTVTQPAVTAPTVAATPTITTTPEPALPLPELDYTEIVRGLSERFVVIGDLQNQYKTGMIDRWQQAQQGETLSTSFCILSAWPGPFELTPEQLEKLNAPGVGDPVLTDAISLINEGLAKANEARALYEPGCQAGTLADSADQGIALATEAVDRLTEAQQKVDVIRGRQ